MNQTSGAIQGDPQIQMAVEDKEEEKVLKEIPFDNDPNNCNKNV